MFRHRGSVSPIPQSGLSLWLKADAGTTTSAEQFISQIIFSGAGTTTSNGTYTRASGGTTSFSGPNGNILGLDIIDSGTLYFQIQDADFGDTTYTVGITYDQITYIGVAAGAAPAPTATTTLTPTGNTIVTAWADQSGNGNNATARTENATLVSSVINGKPILRFDGAANLITNNFFAHNYNTPITIIAVSKASGSTVFSGNPTARYIMGVANNGGYDAGLTYGAYGTETPNFSVGFGIAYVEGQDIESSAMGENQVGLSSSINSGTLISAFLNGNAVGTADPADQSGGGNSTGEFSIGSEVTLDEVDNFFCTCDIAEIIIYNRAITTPERQQVEAYLNAKYAIY
jgi:hypothetical protein